MHASRTAAFTALALMVVGVATAVAGPFAPGTMEYSPLVAFNRSSFTPAGSTTAFSVTHLNLSASAARVMSPQFQVQGGLMVQHRDWADAARTSYGGSFGGQWNFAQMSNTLYPFLSASLGGVVYHGDGVNDKALVAPMIRLGFRSMLNDAHSLNVSLGYQHEINHSSTFEESSNLFDVGVGMSLFK